MSKLNQSTIEHLKYYVYLLIDPRDNQIFYVGKGKGNRINSHRLDALVFGEDKSEKLSRIIEILSDEVKDDDIVLKVLRHGLSEKEALEVEAAVIDLLRDQLTNIVSGHHSDKQGLSTIQELEIYYQAEPAVFNEPVMLININDKYQACKNLDEIYEATRSAWRVSLIRANQIKIVCATYRGIIRGVFEVENWQKHKRRDGRYEFIGRPADARTTTRYINHSIEEYQKTGSQNPVKYVGK
ncbi:hypothetical protein COY17_01680 [Candidatus Saccharibacteria bacterium CG_4_10_14_0_2_um_filter_52_9]|nr:MAG: hypothetical protein COY17_01680 [Candidatus Saccharibacteria bacterium CG_4_10_14_0_2_um_filter_52_9]